MQPFSYALPTLTAIIFGAAINAQAANLPAPASEEFCAAVQRILANTALESENTVFTNLGDYAASKPAIKPLTNYQVVSYSGQMPMMVSCKVKTAAHLRSAYGEEAAGEQLSCPAVTRLAQGQAVAELARTNPEAAERARAIVVEDNEPYASGRGYLGDFQLSFIGEDGAVHLNSPGLFQDYDAWFTWILPDRLQGQNYCHIATADYIKALALGDIEPGTSIVLDENHPVTPR
ncbi:MAG: hypothetical protein KJO76_04085 [Gammaproteobacteria bacterium]|nr:hypothetical protein [Gammaproteobacteria bacterium]MBT8444969.1 hypothetical protein [Gammaproteobacteria bacterium]